MNTSNQSNTSNEKPSTIEDIIRTIQEKSKDGSYIFRGERQCRNKKVSSKLYRDFEDIDSETFDIEVIQKEMLSGAKKHTGHYPQSGETPPDFRPTLARMFRVREEDTAETIDFEILTEIQHYGGKTNLIDFTTDYCIALFFACDGHHDKDGRLILLKTQNIKDMIKYPKEPRHRVIAQKSVIVRPPKGYIEQHEYHIVKIPAKLKEEVLQYLEKYHGIFTETIYNDLHGFIRNQDIHGDANTSFYRGLACSNRGDKVESKEEKQKEYEEAITHYTKVIELRPDFAGAYNNRGSAYSDKGELDRAIKDYDTAIEIKPDYANAYNNRGSVYSDKGEFDKAIKDYDTAIEIKPDHDAYINRGSVYSDKGEFDKAIKDYDTAIEIKPDHDAYINRGIVYNKKGEFDKAIKDYDTAIEIKPNYAKAYNSRGIAYGEKGELDKAIKDCDMAIEINPNYADAYNNRGFTYQKKDDVDNAIKDYNTAIELDPGMAIAYTNRGEAWLHLKEWDKARTDLMTAKDMGISIIESFQNDYKSVADFEQKYNVELPEDIAALLTPPQL